MKKLLIIASAALLLAGCGNAENNDKTEDKPEKSETVEITAAPEVTTEAETEAETAETATEAAETVTEAVTEAPTEPVTEAVTVPEKEPNDGMLVRILDYIPDAHIDLRYATTNNFTGVVLYSDPEAYICYGTVKKLIKVQDELREKGYSILIWDAYRSPEAQQRLWNAYPDPNFVADPKKGLTSHSRGGTVDISIVRTDGSAVEMPSGFDEFNSHADRVYSDVSAEAAANAGLLEQVMYNNGFTGYYGEWWDYTDTNSYTLEFPSAGTETEPVGETADEFLTSFLEKNNYTLADISSSNQIIAVDSNYMNCEVYCYEKKDGSWSSVQHSYGILGQFGTKADKREGDKCTPKAIPHNDCRADAQSIFPADCTEISQAYWRMSRDFCAR